MKWQPIKTAPLNTPILLFYEDDFDGVVTQGDWCSVINYWVPVRFNSHSNTYYDKNQSGCCANRGSPPTHWKHIPLRGWRNMEDFTGEKYAEVLIKLLSQDKVPAVTTGWLHNTWEVITMSIHGCGQDPWINPPPIEWQPLPSPPKQRKQRK